MAKQKITLKQHKFVLEYLKSGNATNAAIRAGYARKSARVTACRMLTYANIKNAIAVVNKATDDKSIADILERKQTLTEIIRGRVGHFVTAGADGVVPNVGPENVNSAALKSVKSRCITMGEGGGKKDAVVTEVEVRDQVQAIAELNKMDHVYDAGAGDHQLVIILRDQPNPDDDEMPAIDVSAPKQIASHGAK